MVQVHFKNIRKTILEELEKATEKIVVAVYWFTNLELFQKLLAKVAEGLVVEIIIHNDYINNRDTGLDFQGFIDIGGYFYFSDTENPMHNKFCVIDNKTLINGSYNWTYYAEDRNRENILVIKSETEVINEFVAEFDRLKSQIEKIDKIRQLTKFEMDDYNQLRARDYLANDIVFQANETGNKKIVDTAFLIAPDNIDVQRIAVSLDLTKKWKLKHSIGASIVHDGYLIIVPKDTILPISQSKIVQTVDDNQRSVVSAICCGENSRASKNKKLLEMKIVGIPPKPAGQAKLKYIFTIDVYGNLRMEKFSLDNGRGKIVNKNIIELLEEVVEP
jgi:hypothetical protein